MKNITTYLIAIIAIISFNACTVSNEVHFNKNYSGTYATNVDIGDMIDMVKSMDSSMEDASQEELIGNVVSSEQRDELITMLNGLEGISNARFEASGESSIEFSFDFEDVELLNSAFTAMQSKVMEEEGMMDTGMGLPAIQLPQFQREKKEITYLASTEELPLEEIAGDEDAAGMMEMMFSMMDYTVSLSFDRKIKSVDLNGVDLVSQDKHTVKTRMDLEEFMKGGAKSIAVKLK